MPHRAHAPGPALLVLAKAPVAGRAKTRMCPPLRKEQAAELAEAALLDTLAAVLETPASRHVLVLDGEPGEWLPVGVELLPQRDGGLAARLAGAFADVGQPALLVGMDTPQVSSDMLAAGLEMLTADGTDAVLGDTDDGGYWTIGLRSPDRRAFEGVPMSLACTGAHQRRRLYELGLHTVMLPRLRDVDHYEDAVAVAAAAPHTRFATVLERMAHELAGAAV
jgi:rSAM/selenodomain-associated transferase 1